MVYNTNYRQRVHLHPIIRRAWRISQRQISLRVIAPCHLDHSTQYSAMSRSLARQSLLLIWRNYIVVLSWWLDPSHPTLSYNLIFLRRDTSIARPLTYIECFVIMWIRHTLTMLDDHHDIRYVHIERADICTQTSLYSQCLRSASSGQCSYGLLWFGDSNDLLITYTLVLSQIYDDANLVKFF